MRLEPGMLIRTNYSHEAYRIVRIERGCTCPSYRASLEEKEPAPRAPHINIHCADPEDPSMRVRYYLNGWDETTLTSLDRTYCGYKIELAHDTITILPADKPIQQTLF